MRTATYCRWLLCMKFHFGFPLQVRLHPSLGASSLAGDLQGELLPPATTRTKQARGSHVQQMTQTPLPRRGKSTNARAFTAPVPSIPSTRITCTSIAPRLHVPCASLAPHLHVPCTSLVRHFHVPCASNCCVQVHSDSKKETVFNTVEPASSELSADVQEPVMSTQVRQHCPTCLFCKGFERSRAGDASTSTMFNMPLPNCLQTSVSG